jgi:hypothetical protein
MLRGMRFVPLVKYNFPSRKFNFPEGNSIPLMGCVTSDNYIITRSRLMKDTAAKYSAILKH